MTTLDLYNKGSIELESIQTTLVLQEQDILMPGSSIAPYTKDIVIKGNKDTNKLFGYLFNVNIKNSSFDIYKKIDCQIIRDGSVVFPNAYLQLVSINSNHKTPTGKDEHTYTVRVTSKKTDFFEKIKNLELTDLNFDSGITPVIGNQIGYDYGKDGGIPGSWAEKTGELIRDNWARFYPSHEWKYIHKWNGGQSNIFKISDFAPAIFARAFFDKIHSNNGFTARIPEITVDDYLSINKLIIPFTDEYISTSTDRKFDITTRGSTGNDKTIPYQPVFFPNPPFPTDPPEYTLPGGGIVLNGNPWLAGPWASHSYNLLSGFPSDPIIFTNWTINGTLPNPNYNTSTGVYRSNVIGTHKFRLKSEQLSLRFKLQDGTGALVSSGVNASGWRVSSDFSDAKTLLYLYYLELEIAHTSAPTTILRSYKTNALKYEFKAGESYTGPHSGFDFTKNLSQFEFATSFELYDGEFVSSIKAVRLVRPGDIDGNEIEINEDSQIFIIIEYPSPATSQLATVDTRLILNDLVEVSFNIDYQFNWGHPFVLNEYIPRKIKQSDFMKSMMRMYNMISETNPSNPDEITYFTRAEYYKRGDFLDWTSKLDRSKPVKVEFLKDKFSKKFKHSYKPDTDVWNTAYTSVTKAVYGEHTSVLETDFNFDTTNIETVFSPTPTLHNYQANMFLPAISNDHKSNIRILLDGGITLDNGYWRLLGPRKLLSTPNPGYTQDGITYNKYRTYSMLDNPEHPMFSLEFGESSTVFNNVQKQSPSNFLFNSFIEPTIRQINNGRILTAYFDLNAIDIANLKLYDTIFIDDASYYINKLEYDFAGNTLTKVELYTVGEENSIKIPAPTSNPIGPAPYNPIVIQKSLGGGPVGGGLSNELGDNIEALVVGSDNLIQGNNSIVIGSNNIVSFNYPKILVGNNLNDSSGSSLISSSIYTNNLKVKELSIDKGKITNESFYVAGFYVVDDYFISSKTWLDLNDGITISNPPISQSSNGIVIDNGKLGTRKVIPEVCSWILADTSITTIPSTNTWVKADLSTNLGYTNNGGFQHTNNRITNVSGNKIVAEILISTSIESHNGDLIKLSIFKNGVIEPQFTQGVEIGANHKEYGLSMLGIVELDPTEYIELWIMNENTTNSIYTLSFSGIIKELL